MKHSIISMILLLAWCGTVYAAPVEISTQNQLLNVRNNLAGDYIQTADIVLSGEWDPIGGGGSGGGIFTGSYDGQNYTISNLTINRSATNDVGLFGHVGQGAVIQNVRLENVDVKGARGVGSLIGRVTGNNQTLIMRCYAAPAAVDPVGTVVGFNGATGGLVGSHNSVQETPGGENNPVISQCYANINVSLADPPNDGAGLDKWGGLAGCSQKGTILDSYARGSVTVNNTGAQRVGGLVGCNELRGRILRSYSTGEVNSNGTLVGGLLGNIESSGGNRGVVLDSFWDENAYSGDNNLGTKKTTAQMQSINTYTDTTTDGLDTPWDFDTIWAINASINDGYPYLLWEDNTPPAVDAIDWIGGTTGALTDWNTASNWSTNTVPTITDNVIIPDTANDPVIGPDVIAQVHNLTLETDATLTIQSNAGYTGTLIVTGASTGNVTVERHLKGERWYIIGPPVVDQGISGLLTDESNNIAYDSATENYGATDYNEADNKWNAYFKATTIGNFINGAGYLLRRGELAGAGLVSFVGTLQTGPVSQPVTTDGFRWNAVGNPYTSAIGVTGNATSPNNFLFVNANNLDAAHRAIYIWDDDIEKNYVIVNSANFSNYPTLNTDYIQLGQGFIVRAAGLGNEVVFTPDMRVGQPALMLKSPIMDKMKAAPLTRQTKTQWPGVVLRATVNNGADAASAGIAFYEGMTLGLDPGYDAGVFQGNPEVVVYTQLAAGDDGEDYGLQCLPPSAMDWITLDIGLETRRTGTVTFRFEKSDLPQGTVLILEDQKQKTQKTIVSSSDTYTTVVDASEPAYGRFYLSFSDDPNAPPESPNDPTDDRADENKSSSSGCFIGTVFSSAAASNR